MEQKSGEEEATQKKSSRNLHRADYKLCMLGLKLQKGRQRTVTKELEDE